MTKTRWIGIIIFVLLMMTQMSAYADSGLVEVEVGIHDSKVYFNNKEFNNDELNYPFIKYDDVIYFPLAWNTLNAIGFQPIVKEDVNEIMLTIIDSNEKPALSERSTKSSTGTKKAEVKNTVIKLENEVIDTEGYKILKYNHIVYLPLTWNVLNQLDIYYSADGAGDMHISSLSKKALEQSVNKANDAYVDKLVKFVRSVNRSLSEKEAERYVNSILKESRTYGIDETWIFAMVWQESKFDSDCEYKNAVGIMQILVSTGKNFGLSKQDLKTPEKSIKVGVQYVKSGLKRFGSMEKAVLAYNQGSGAVASGNYKTWYLEEIQEKRAKLLKLLD